MKNLWVVGDSTLSSFNDKYYYPRYGYGTMLSKYLDDEICVKNIALSGRSSKSYTAEPEYRTLLSGMEKGDFLIIGFGHNDEKTEENRFTSGTGSYEEDGTFANSLYSNYIVPARNAGCSVILCTPIVRRSATGKWKDMELHVTGNVGKFIGGDYAKAVRDTGKTLGIPVVDMTSMTKEFYDTIGPENSIYLHAWPSNNPLSVDNTHTNIWGGRVNAYLCLRSVKALGIKGISEHINVENEIFDDGLFAGKVPVPSKDRYLVPNENYFPTIFNAQLPESKNWKNIGEWKGTVFGDISEQPSMKNFILGQDEHGNMHIAVRNNSGKIAAVSDGIAMYYREVPADKKFLLKAKARINDYFLNDQVSFGLMARDDMYIDLVTSDILGDYVAAAPLLLTHGECCVNCFARKSGEITYGGVCTKQYSPGDEVSLSIESTEDGYACTFADEQTITGGFDFKLTAVNPESVYVGMFVSRNADVTFSDISLTIM